MKGSITQEGSTFERDKRRFLKDKQGVIYELLNEYLFREQVHIDIKQISGITQGESKPFRIHKGLLGTQYFPYPDYHPRRIAPGSTEPLFEQERVNENLPYFVEGPTLSTRDDVIIVSFKASEGVRANVYYSTTATDRPVVPPSNFPLQLGHRFNGIIQGEIWQRDWQNGGYDGVKVYDGYVEEYDAELPGLVSGREYGVMVGIWAKKDHEYVDRGPVYSEDLRITLPNL